MYVYSMYCKAVVSSEPEFVNFYGAQESILPAYVDRRAGSTTLFVVPTRQAI